MSNEDNSDRHPHSGPRSEQDWYKFEKRCGKLFQSFFPNSQYRVAEQRHVAKTRKSMDIHIAERRQGGKGFVFDCKHYTGEKSKIQKKHVDQLLEYKKNCRASSAVMILSSSTAEANNLPASVERYAERSDVQIVVMNDFDQKWLQNWLYKRSMSLKIKDIL